MKVQDFCSRKVVTVETLASLQAASILMRTHHVGALVVVEANKGDARPVGIITDRDIVMTVLAIPGMRPEGIHVCDLMSTRLAIAREGDGVFEAARTMSEFGVRRLPVVAEDGALRGMVTADDILRVVSAAMGNLATALQRGTDREALTRRLDLLVSGGQIRNGEQA